MPDQACTEIIFSQIFKNAHDASILVMDEQGTIISINQGVERSYGYLPDDLIGKNFSILFTEEDQLKNQDKIELSTCIEKGFATDRNYVVHKNGSYIWSHGETIFTETKDGVVRLIKLMYDINEQKLLEISLVNVNQELVASKSEISKMNEELKAKNDELLRINKDLDSFVYTASHDLKSPINNIQALISIIQDELSEDSKNRVHQELQMLNMSIEKFRGVIGELSDTLSEQSSKNNKIYFAQLIEEVKMSLHEEIKSTNTSFIVNIKNAPYIQFSRKNLRSILFNLISNSIKYRCPARRPEIGLFTNKADGFIEIKITDNGLGMDEAEKNQIFEMYKRFQQDTEGSGVGLSIVKKLVENSGGKIVVESEKGNGSVFRVFLKDSGE